MRIKNAINEMLQKDKEGKLLHKGRKQTAAKSRLPAGVPFSKTEAERMLKFDFGVQITFASYEKLDRTFDEMKLQRELLAEYPDFLKGCSVRLFLREDGGKALRIQKSIPTFDSGDREWDSWHALYLLPGAVPGKANGIYCTGGYRLSFAMVCKNLLELSHPLRDLLDEAGH